MLSSLTLPSLLTRYEAGELIGHGDDASVYRTLDRRTSKTVAVKVFDQRMELDSSFVANFRREARRATHFRHPNVIHTLGYGYVDQHYYLTLEYIDGGSFERYVPAPAAGLDPNAIRALLEVCQGLQYVHEQGVLHRNLEPANILLRTSGEAVVSGLGPLHQFASSGLTQTNILIESLNYASPEQLAGNKMTIASDIYSFGLILYQTCTGRLPFTEGNLVQLAMQQINQEPPSPRLFNPNLSPGLEAAILRCLRKDPAQRYASMREVGEVITATMPSLDEPLTLEHAINLGPVGTASAKRSRRVFGTPSRARSPKDRVRTHPLRDLAPVAPDMAPGRGTEPMMVETIPGHSGLVEHGIETQAVETDSSRPNDELAVNNDADRTVLMPIVTADPAPVAHGRAIPIQRNATSRQRHKRPSSARHILHTLAERVAEATA